MCCGYHFLIAKIDFSRPDFPKFSEPGALPLDSAGGYDSGPLPYSQLAPKPAHFAHRAKCISILAACKEVNRQAWCDIHPRNINFHLVDDDEEDDEDNSDNEGGHGSIKDDDAGKTTETMARTLHRRV